MNMVVTRLAFQALLGRKRSLLLLGLAALLFAVAGLTRWGSGADPASTPDMIRDFGLGTLVPVMCLLIGTGVISPEIEDGSIVYLLAKPLPRRTIAFSKLAVALVTAVVFSVATIAIGSLIAGDDGGAIAGGLGVAAALAAFTYTAVFFAIAVVSRNPVIVGLVYALVWEGALAGYIPGVKDLSIRQWAIAPAQRLLDAHPAWHVTGEVGLTTSLVMLGLVTIAAIVVAVQRLKTLPIKVSE
jgi:ABC-2 type transport system permease protein